VGTLADLMPCRVLLVDPKAEDVGHLLDDDLFLAQCLSGLVQQVDVRSSAASVERIRGIPNVNAKVLDHHSVFRHSARMSYIAKLAGLHADGYNVVVFQSFEELSTLLFMVRYPRAKVVLIVTNNLSPDRFQRRPLAARALLGTVLSRASAVVVHCQFEVDFIARVFPTVGRRKVWVVPFHKIGIPRPRLGLSSRRRALLFIGPEQPHKTLHPLLELIDADTSRRYEYIVTGADPSTCSDRFRQLCRSSNVRMLRGYLDDAEYYSLISSVLLVILTHDRSYEGRLSGALCDAFSCYTPVLSMEMEPVREFFAKYGPMGYMVNFGDPGWSNDLLRTDIEADFGRFQNNIERIKAACSIQNVQMAFRHILSKVCDT